MTFTNLFPPTDSLFLAILLVKQYIELDNNHQTQLYISYQNSIKTHACN